MTDEPARRGRIVAADNDPDALELVVSDLALEGHDIAAATTVAAEVEALCAEHRPDVLVVDHRMPPGPSGTEIAAIVRDAGTVGAVIVYSNYRDRKIQRAAEANGAHFLPKGNLRALRRVVVELLEALASS